MKQVKSYECEKCHKLFNHPVYAARCEFSHAQELYANELWNNNYLLSEVDELCGFGWNIKRSPLGNATKESCFIIPNLENCDKPAYQIIHIGAEAIIVCGKVSHEGHVNKQVTMSTLKECAVCKREELYVYCEDV